MMSLQTEAVRGGESGDDQHANDLIVKLQLDNLAQVVKTLIHYYVSNDIKSYCKIAIFSLKKKKTKDPNKPIFPKSWTLSAFDAVLCVNPIEYHKCLDYENY